MEVDWNSVLSELMGEVFRILIPLFVVLALKWLVEIWKRLKEKNPQLAELLEKAASIGYAAAEEYFKGQNVLGERKMLYAIDRADEYLKQYGISMPIDVIRDTITEYGVSSYKFNWTRPKQTDLFSPEEEAESEEETEGD